MSLYMETTEIPATKTVSEVTALLAECGARRIMQEYGAGQRVQGIEFSIDINGQELYYALPVRIEPIFEYLQAKRSPKFRHRTESLSRDRLQAERTAWRLILRWIEAQFALIKVGLGRTEEVFLPYMKVSPKETLFERYEKRQLLLPPSVEGPDV